MVAAIALLLPWLIGGALWHREWTTLADGPISVAIVQGSVPQDKKWSPEWRDEILARYRSLTEPHLGARLVIWPEAALPEAAQFLVDYLKTLWDEARAKNSDLLVGAINYDHEHDAYYNGLLALNERVEWYHKRRLVPYGEFFPVPDFVRNWLKMMSLPSTNMSAGADEQSPLHGAGQAIGITICYEDAYGSEQLEVLKSATLLVNVTNDAWFGDYSAAPQHLEISRMRALEAGRDMARAANDGISALINAQGKVMATLPRYAQAVLSGQLQPRTGLTPYARIGNVPLIVALALLCIVAVSSHLSSLLRSISRKGVAHP
jgi:apolipoprotein N-acyltransferase